MFLRVISLCLIIFSHAFTLELKSEYKVYSSDFNASNIDPFIKEDFIIFHFEKSRHQKSYSSSKLIKILNEKGLSVIDKSKGIVHLKRQANLDYAPLKQKIKNYYLGFFPKMEIQDIIIKSGSFIEELPHEYELIFKNSAYLYPRSSLQILSSKENKRHFVSYELKATLKLFKASHNINRGKILSQRDLIYKEEPFTRLKALPLQSVLKSRHRLKKRLISGKIVYLGDIEKLPAVIKNKRVNVRLVSGSVHLEFQAISMEDGHIGDEVFIKKRDGNRLKAKVINNNLVEIQ